MADPITCANPTCGRPYNRVFAKCPFCNTPSKASASAAAAPSPAPAAPASARGAVAPAAPAAPDYAALAEQVAAQHQLFMPLEFHPAAVPALDAFFDQTWGSAGLGAGDDAWSPNRGQRVAIVNLGTFFGEVIRRTFDGRWQPDPGEPDNPYKVRIAVPTADGEVGVGPVMVAFNRLKHGASAPFATILAQFHELLHRGSTPADAEGYLRYARYFLGVKRPDLARELGRQALACGPAPALRIEIEALLQSAAASAEAATRAAAATAEAAPAEAAPETTAPETTAPAAAASSSPPVTAAPPATIAPGDDEIRAQLVAAADAYTHGRHEAALAAFARVLEIDPANVAALIGTGGTLHALGRWREALDWLRGCAGRDDCEPGRAFLEACVADDLDEVVTAHGLFATLVRDPRLAPERQAIAAERTAALATHPDVLLAAIDRIPELADAVAACARICEQHPTLAKPWSERGVGLVMLGRTDEALACFDRAAALAPADPTAYDHKAVTLARLQRTDAALAALEDGLRHCPTAGVLLTRKGIFLTQLGRYDEASSALDTSLRVDPAYTRTLAYRGDLERLTGRTADAIASLEQFLATGPKDDQKLVSAARRQLWALRHPGQSRDPGRAEACLSAGLVAATAGRDAEALASFDAAIAANPLDANPWLNRGASLSRLGRLEDALVAYRSAEDLLDTPSPLVRDGIVSCLVRLHREQEALDQCGRYGDRRGAARLLVRMGRAAEALPIYQALVAKAPADKGLLVERVEALVAADRLLEAAAAMAAAKR